MGEEETSKPWLRTVREVLEELRKRFNIEAAIVFGSWSRGGGGEWSDVDLLVVTNDVGDTNILDRFTIAAEYRRRKVDLFLYTYSELERMALRGNALALSVLLEGVPVVASSRVEALRASLAKKYRRVGRAWVTVA